MVRLFVVLAVGTALLASAATNLGLFQFLHWGSTPISDSPGTIHCTPLSSPAGYREVSRLTFPYALLGVRGRTIELFSTNMQAWQEVAVLQSDVAIPPFELRDGRILIVLRSSDILSLSLHERAVLHVARGRVQRFLVQTMPGVVVFEEDVRQDQHASPAAIAQASTRLAPADPQLMNRIAVLHVETGTVADWPLAVPRNKLWWAAGHARTGALALGYTGGQVALVAPDKTVTRWWHLPEATPPFHMSFGSHADEIVLTMMPRGYNTTPRLLRCGPSGVTTLGTDYSAGAPIGRGVTYAIRNDSEFWRLEDGRPSLCLLRATLHNGDCAGGNARAPQISPDGSMAVIQLHPQAKYYGRRDYHVVDLIRKLFVCLNRDHDEVVWLRHRVSELPPTESWWLRRSARWSTEADAAPTTRARGALRDSTVAPGPNGHARLPPSGGSLSQPGPPAATEPKPL